MPSRMPTLATYAQAELAALAAEGRARALRPAVIEQGAYLVREGRRLLNFAGNDYLGLSQHPRVIAALAGARAGAASSRLVVGDHAGYAPLEEALAVHHGQQAALVFSSGYAANLGVISALAGAGDLILADRLSHASLLDGARLSGATLKRFAHNDVAHAEKLLAQHRGSYAQCWLMTEAIFSMDGDAASLVELADLARRQDAWLLVDAAHALVPLDMVPDVLIGTLSKSLGGVGGYAASCRPVIDLLIASARSLIFSTGLPPGNVAAAHVALEIAQAEPQRAATAHAHACRFAARLGLPLPAAAIVPVPVGENMAALQWSRALEMQGFAVPAIRPPTVPTGTARLRASFSALHETADVDALADAMQEVRSMAC